MRCFRPRMSRIRCWNVRRPIETGKCERCRVEGGGGISQLTEDSSSELCTLIWMLTDAAWKTLQNRCTSKRRSKVCCINYSLVPEGERLVAILANSCKRFLLGHCDGLRDRSMAKAAAFTRPALRDKMRMSVERHCWIMGTSRVAAPARQRDGSRKRKVRAHVIPAARVNGLRRGWLVRVSTQPHRQHHARRPPFPFLPSRTMSSSSSRTRKYSAEEKEQLLANLDLEG